MTRQTLSFILKMLRPFTWAVTVMFLLSVVWATDMSLRPYLMKLIIDVVSERPAVGILRHIINPAVAYLSILFLLSFFIILYQYSVRVKMMPRLRRRIIRTAFDTLLKKSHEYYQRNLSGSMTNKIRDLADGIPELLSIFIDIFVGHILLIVVAVCMLWQVNASFGLFLMSWSVLSLGLALVLSKRITRLSDAWSEVGSTVFGQVVDALSSMLSVFLFARKTFEKKRLRNTLGVYLKAEQKLEWTQFWFYFFFNVSFALMQLGNLFVLIRGREQGQISVGDFALVLTLNMMIFEYLWILVREFSRFSEHWGRVTQALRMLVIAPKVQDRPGASQLIVQRGEISFNAVHFRYDTAEHPIFQNQSIHIPSGQRVGLVGYSGAGKSTFVNLILRLFDVDSGQILIDGQNIREVTQDSLREAIGMIPQDPLLFHRSLMENIRYGKENAKDKSVIEAAQKAHAHEFILKLPDSYETLVGERGVKLSGGQRQRIAIARAILKNAPILILDEATSQLDSITEELIQKSLWEVMQQKTTLVIAHRLSTLLHMDRILVFDQGKIVEDGTHQELIDNQGLYKTLWDAQVGGFLPDKAQEESKNETSALM